MTKNSSLSGPRLREEIELPPSDPGSRQGSRFWPSQHCHGRHPRQGGGRGRPASRLRLRARGHQDCRGRPKIHSSRTTINFLFHWRLCGLTQTLFSSFLKEANPNFLALRNSTETFCLALTRVRSFYGNEERFTRLSTFASGPIDCQIDLPRRSDHQYGVSVVRSPTTRPGFN